MTEPIEQEDPISPMQVECMMHWSIFDAYCRAGFQRHEAMELLLAAIDRNTP